MGPPAPISLLRVQVVLWVRKRQTSVSERGRVHARALTVHRRAVRRKANLEVTGEEMPKTRLRRRKDNKRLCREKKPVWALPDEEKPVSLVSDEKSQFEPTSGEKLQQTTFRARKKSKSLS